MFFRSDQVARFFTGVVQDITTSIVGQMQGDHAQVSLFFPSYGLVFELYWQECYIGWRVWRFTISPSRDSEMPRSKC
jgi:hypothetical protein